MAEQGQIITIASLKGGVGKTTLTTNLAVAIARRLSSARGRETRVAVIDNDPQASTTRSFGIEEVNLEDSIYEVYKSDIIVGGEPLNIIDVLMPVDAEGIDLAPSHIRLSKMEMELAAATDREKVLLRATRSLKGRYAYTFVDTAPSIGLVTRNALTAADGVLIPVQMSKLGLDGLTDLLDTIKDVQRKLNPRLKIIGILPTFYDNRNKVSKSALAYLMGDQFAADYPEVAGKLMTSRMDERGVYEKVQVESRSIYNAPTSSDIRRDELERARVDCDQIADEVLQRCQTT